MNNNQQVFGPVTVSCEDCMDLMARYPDKYFDLAIVDPPYGGGELADSKWTRNGGRLKKYGYDLPKWDYDPQPKYFKELFRISKNQIIWGSNFFKLPTSRNFIVWYKPDIPEKMSFASCELAWVSIQGNAKVYIHSAAHQLDRIHPTQKPVKLYKWILSRYAKKGDKILDTHLGSGSSAIAAYDMGFEFWGCEIIPEYYKCLTERIKNFAAQGVLNFEEAI